MVTHKKAGSGRVVAWKLTKHWGEKWGQQVAHFFPCMSDGEGAREKKKLGVLQKP